MGGPLDRITANEQAAILHATYAQLLSRAALAGWIEPGGLTPEEQCSLLGASDQVPGPCREGWRRLGRLLEGCVYAGKGTEREFAEAQELCAQLADLVDRAVPGIPLRNAPSTDWSRLLRGAASILLVAAVLAAGVFVAPRLQVALSSASSPMNSPRAPSEAVETLRSERSSLNSISGKWNRPAASPTYQEMQVDPVTTEREAGTGSRIDLNTGVDGNYPTATDPFEPPLSWTHRQSVFARIDRNYQFIVPPSGESSAFDARASGARRYRMKARVALQAGKPVAIPSPADDAKVVWWSSAPESALKFTRDAGDALCVTGDVSRTIDLTCELVSDSDYAGADLPDTPFVPAPVDLPSSVRKTAAIVLEHVGDLPGATFRDTVRRIQAYCAGFAVAPIRSADDRGNYFLTLAMSRKGVCRHRALVFFVLANAVGVKTRYVENPVHAFCEVQLPGGAWRRMEFRLESWEEAAGSPWAAGGSAFRARNPLRILAPLGVLGVVIIGLALLLVLGGERDRSGHLVPRTTGPSAHDARGARDNTLPLGQDLRDLAEVAAREAAAAGGSPEVLREACRRLQEFSGTPTVGIQDGALQGLRWDCLLVMRSLKSNEGEKRT